MSDTAVATLTAGQQELAAIAQPEEPKYVIVSWLGADDLDSWGTLEEIAEAPRRQVQSFGLLLRVTADGLVILAATIDAESKTARDVTRIPLSVISKAVILESAHEIDLQG